MAIGIAIRRVAQNVAERAAPMVKKVTGLDTLILCAILLWLYRADIVGAVGAYAIGTQILYYAVLGSASYLFGFGLSYTNFAYSELHVTPGNSPIVMFTVKNTGTRPGAEVAQEAVEYLAEQGEKIGIVKVHLYRPFPVEQFVKALPATVKAIAVLDRAATSP